jgi:hypothetical protein
VKETRIRVNYYYRGIQEGIPVYSKRNEYPWKGKRECQQVAMRDGERTVFVKEEINDHRRNGYDHDDTCPG